MLKLDGDVELPNSIVLTRDHYVRFDADSVPLASVVQSHMVTKHVPFVGYSLSDENFIRLACQVRQLFQRMQDGGEQKSGPGPQKVGTVLSLFKNDARRKLWEKDLDFITMAEAPPRGQGGSVEGHGCSRRPTGDLPGLPGPGQLRGGLLFSRPPLRRSPVDDADRNLRDGLTSLGRALPGTQKSSTEEKVERLLKDLGWSPQGG